MRTLPILVLMLAACGSDPAVDPDAGADATPPDAYVDLSGPLFDPNHVVEVAIELPVASWDALRMQTRTFNSVIEGRCLDQPIPSPFTTYAAKVVIDGTTLPNVGIKKKGFFGSLDPVKPSLKITVDEYTQGAEYLGLEKLTLNNSHQDPSYVRQCLAYQLFAKAGIVVPRCNFAHVRVNGADLGIYVNVETIDHKLTKRRFADGTGPLYEGTLSDFRTTWVNTFDPKGKGDGTDLGGIVNVLETASDAQLVSALAPHLDVDAFTTYWAMEIIANHWDGYANDKNNYFVYHDPTSGQLQFIPWGVDATFQPGVTFDGIGATNGPVAVAAAGVIANRLFKIPAARTAFINRQRELLANVFDETALKAEVARMEALIAPIVDTAQGTGWHADVGAVRTFITNRRSILSAALDAGPTWTKPLDGYPCLDVIARVQGTFSTTYGTLGAANPLATGAGTFTITIGGVTTTLTPVGSTAGTDPNAADKSVVQIYGVRASDNHVFAISFASQKMYFFPREVTVGFFDGSGALFEYNPTTNMTAVVGYALGEVMLTQASTTAGGVVAGSFSSNADQPGTP